MSTDEERRRAQEKWLDFQNGILAAGLIGSASLVAAMPLALPEKSKTPWWGWLAGAGGLGLAATSIALGVTVESAPGGSCSVDIPSGIDPGTFARTCFDRGERISIAYLLGLSSAPLLTMPLVYLFRPKKAALEPTVRAGRGHAYLGVRGSF